MQILEQLAFGQNISTMDIVSECSAIIGYLECMNDHTTFGVMESVVMEGFDPKVFFKKIWTFIKGIFTKIGQMINKLIGFVRGRKGKLKQKEVASFDNNSNNGVSNDGATKDESSSGDSKNDESISKNGGISGPTSTVRIGMRSKDELTKEVFEKHPYSGVHPNAISMAFQYVFNFSDNTLRSAITEAGMAISGARKMMNTNSSDKKTRWGDYNKDDLEDDLSRVLRAKEKGTQYILSKIADTDNKTGWTSLDGKIKSPQDFKNVASLLYAGCRSEKSNLGDYTNAVLNRDRFEFIVERYNNAVLRHSSFCDAISTNMVKNNTDVQNYIKKCNDMLNSLDKIHDVDQKFLSDGFNAVGNLLNIISQCISYTTIGISTFYSQVEADLNRLGTYIDTVNSSLSAVK